MQIARVNARELRERGFSWCKEEAALRRGRINKSLRAQHFTQQCKMRGRAFRGHLFHFFLFFRRKGIVHHFACDSSARILCVHLRFFFFWYFTIVAIVKNFTRNTIPKVGFISVCSQGYWAATCTKGDKVSGRNAPANDWPDVCTTKVEPKANKVEIFVN